MEGEWGSVSMNTPFFAFCIIASVVTAWLIHTHLLCSMIACALFACCPLLADHATRPARCRPLTLLPPLHHSLLLSLRKQVRLRVHISRPLV